MTNTTDTNQASEDELKKRIGNLHAYNYEGDDVTVKVMVDEDILESIAKYVKALIRTEKLKLLADVRERVIGQNDRGTITNPDSPSYGEPYESTMADKNDLRAELDKLEAEL